MNIAAYVLVAMLAVAGIFQILLVAGMPFGEIAWGGQHGKKLSKRLRIASCVSVMFFLLSILVVLTKVGAVTLFGDSFVNGYMLFLTVYLGLGIIMNAISRSKKERYWAPYIAVMVALCLIIINS